MEKKNDQHSRQKFIEEQLAALKYEEKALSEVRMTLMNQKWQLASEKDKIKKKIREGNMSPKSREASEAPEEPRNSEEPMISQEPSTSQANSK